MPENSPQEPQPEPTLAQGRVRLPGSDRPPIAAIKSAHELAAEDDPRIEATVVVRRRAPLPDDLPAPLTSAELAEKYGADPADLDAVRAAVTEAGAEVLNADAATRQVQVAGPTSTLEALFGTSLSVVRAHDPALGAERTVRTREGSLSVPASLDGVVTAVLGLDNRPQTRARLQIAHAQAVPVSYTPVELGTVYKFPAGTDGSGQQVAIIELGGGFGQDDLDAYFGSLGLKSPTVTAVSIQGAVNQPGQDPDGADGEVLLDIEVVGALAPASEILVYFAPNTDDGFLQAVTAAAHASPAPAAITISWGASEDDWTAQARTAMDDAFADAGALGVTVTAAAGDDGSVDRATDSQDHCDFPASSPHALACGGTSLRADGSTGVVTSEKVWNNGSGRGATGGGVSDAFGLPSWQQNVGVPDSTAGKVGRGVPDVAGVADPQTGYQIRVDGKSMVIGGTSAVAPLWAALTARLVQALGKPLGLLQPVLYAGVTAGSVPPGFRDITEGTNGGYSAGAGWDACTGLGVPDGEALLTALRGGSGS